MEEKYHQILEGLERDPHGFKPQDIFPINTHGSLAGSVPWLKIFPKAISSLGGLLAYGAPWELR